MQLSIFFAIVVIYITGVTISKVHVYEIPTNCVKNRGGMRPVEIFYGIKKGGNIHIHMQLYTHIHINIITYFFCYCYYMHYWYHY